MISISLEEPELIFEMYTNIEQRLSSLALIHLNYETYIDVNEVCKLFLEKTSKMNAVSQFVV